MAENIQWLGHDVFKISDGSTIIYTDPFRIEEGPDKADIILITHDHFDHCSPEDVAKIQKDDTVIVTTAPCAQKLTGNIEVVRPGSKLEVKGVPIEATWAYNVNKFRSPGEPFHPRSEDFVGFIMTAGGKRIYLVGDSDIIPEMEGISVDVALVPVSGTYVMTAEEAAHACTSTIQAETYIPMHYNEIVGTEEDAKAFAEKVGKGKVRILPES